MSCAGLSVFVDAPTTAMVWILAYRSRSSCGVWSLIAVASHHNAGDGGLPDETDVIEDWPNASRSAARVRECHHRLRGIARSRHGARLRFSWVRPLRGRANARSITCGLHSERERDAPRNRRPDARPGAAELSVGDALENKCLDLLGLPFDAEPSQRLDGRDIADERVRRP